ncbi:MAG: NAD-dependent epimerase/dehydratase family protein, partial [Bacteroidota bacterium]
MNIVLAGATGFIGQKLVLKLQQEGHSLTLLSRHHPVLRESGRPGIVFFHWDAKTVGDWAKHIDGSDAVINLAGEPIAAKRWTEAQKERILASRLNATGAIV